MRPRQRVSSMADWSVLGRDGQPAVHLYQVRAGGREGMSVPECYSHKFFGEQCREPAVFASAGLGNIVDGWTWCLKHAPHKDYRVDLSECGYVHREPEKEKGR